MVNKIDFIQVNRDEDTVTVFWIDGGCQIFSRENLRTMLSEERNRAQNFLDEILEEVLGIPF